MSDKMKSKLFTTPLKYPGKVDIFKKGIVKLHEASDEVLIELFKAGNTDILFPTPEGRKLLFPNEKPIEVKKVEPKSPEMKDKKLAAKKKAPKKSDSEENTSPS